jgi:hypothetical protein
MGFHYLTSLSTHSARGFIGLKGVWGRPGEFRTLMLVHADLYETKMPFAAVSGFIWFDATPSLLSLRG